MRHASSRSLAITLASGLCLPWAAVARDNPVGQTLDLKTGQLDTRTLPSLLGGKQPFKGGVHYVIQLDGPMTPQRMAALAAAGVTPGQYLPDFAYIVDLPNIQPAALRGLGFVVWAGAFDDAWKLSPDFGKRAFATVARQAQAGVGMSQVAVVLFDGETTAQASAEIARLGGRVDGSGMVAGHWVIDATIGTLAAPQLTLLSSVQFVEDAAEAVQRNDSNRWILQSNVATQTPIWDHGIHGENQVGGLIDGTPRESHCMFDDAVAPGPTHRKFIGWHSAGTVDSHGTHTAGTFAGDQTPFNAYTTNDGMAYAAKLSFTNLSSITNANLQTSLQTDHNDGARVHSNSWGDDSTRAYTSWCQAIDAFNYANEDDVVAFAVSNGSLATTPENAVNCLGVGASQDTPSQANHCSGGTGPTQDGRRKPEIYAPGCNTTSASNTVCSTANLTGTSMACPAISGAGLLVRQYYTDGFYPSGAANAPDAFTPSGALIRATLLNGTVDMTGIAGYPSNSEGFGRLLLDNVLSFTSEPRKIWVTDVRNANGRSTGQFTSYPLNVASSGQPLRVTLAFTAPAATVNAANPVINDLNLEVVGPGGTYLGNVFSAGQSTTGGLADTKNNVEMVLLNAPPVGAYTITVRAQAVNQGLQGYALVATGDIGTGCTSPGIVTPPLTQSVPDNYPVSFSVVASGSALNYQWRKNTIPLSNGGTISGALTPTLQISAVTLADAGSYDVVASNDCGSATSIAATLDVFCYPNCDGSTTVPILNIQDFACFLNQFAAGATYANCDNSTTAPTLNVADFGCFLNFFSQGCP